MFFYSNSLQGSNIGDLVIYNWGHQICPSSHYYGPAVRDHYLIHYILNGKGIFQVGDKTYNLGKGQGFLICPDIVTFYQADYDDPWNYAWVGFYGIKAEYYLELANLTQDNPIFLYDRDDYIKNCLMRMSDIDGFSEHGEMELTGLLYLFISKLIEIGSGNRQNIKARDQKEVYVKKAIQYIEGNYSRHLTISQIANYIGIDRKYLSQLFRQHLDTTPKQYLIDYRMERASYLLQNTTLYVGDIARSVGYEDPLQFSKMFKKVKGISPKHYRDRLIRI